MHCKSEPPEERLADEVAALDTAGTATAGKGSKRRCHRRRYGRRDGQTNNERIERGTDSWRANTEEKKPGTETSGETKWSVQGV